MKKKVLIAMLGLAGILTAVGGANAQVAGSSTTVGVAVTELTEVAHGWSATKSILGKAVYNDAGDKIGKVEDLIITPDKHVSYVIVGAGGFVGIGRHNVAIPISQIHEQGGRIILAGATKDNVKAMPEFVYANDTARRDRFLAMADRDVASAKEKIAGYEKKAAAATDDVKAKLQKQNVALNQDLKAVEDKLGEMRKAGENKWKQFEGDVSRKITHLRQALEKSTG